MRAHQIASLASAFAAVSGEADRARAFDRLRTGSEDVELLKRALRQEARYRITTRELEQELAVGSSHNRLLRNFYPGSGKAPTGARFYNSSGFNPASIPDCFAWYRSGTFEVTLASQPTFTAPTAFDNAAWVKTNGTITATDQADPDGTSLAEEFTASSGADLEHRLQQTPTGVGTGQVTVTIDAKKVAGADYLWIRLDGTGIYQFFNLQTGALGAATAGVTNPSITSKGTGWYQLQFTGSNTTTSIAFGMATTDNDVSFAAAGTEKVLIHNARIAQKRVSEWDDKVTPAVDLPQATAGTQPLWVAPGDNYYANYFNGHPYLDFEPGGGGANDNLRGAVAADWKFLHDGSGMTAIVIFRHESAGDVTHSLLDTTRGTAAGTNSGILHWATRDGEQFGFSVTNGAGATCVSITTAGAVLPKNTLCSTVIRYVEGAIPGRAVEAIGRANGAEIGSQNSSTAPSSADPTDPLTIGCRSDVAAANRADCQIAEIVLYNRALSDDEVALLSARYFVPRYGRTI